MKFETTDELIVQAEKDEACEEGIEWCRGKEFQEILQTIPFDYRFWCLLNGYEQFAKHCDWSKLYGDDYSRLLQVQPQFAQYCDWNKLDGRDWSFLLREQPQLAKHCDWSKLIKADWLFLLRKQPQLGKYRARANEIRNDK